MNLNNKIAKGILFSLYRFPEQTVYQLSKTVDADRGKVRYWVKQLVNQGYAICINGRSVRYKLDDSTIEPELRIKGGGVTVIISEDKNGQETN